MKRRGAALAAAAGGLAFVAAAGWWTLGCRARRPAGEAVPATTAAPLAGGTMAVDLYFPGDGELLFPERREVESAGEPPARVRRVVEALLAGPQAPGLHPPLPTGVAVGNVHLAPTGVVYVDLRSETNATPPAGGSLREMLMVYSLVNSILLNVPEASRVVLLWNGNQPVSFSGHLDLTHPLQASPDLIAGRLAG